MNEPVYRLEMDGHVTVDGLIAPDQVIQLACALDRIAQDDKVPGLRRRGLSAYSIRNLIAHSPEVCKFAEEPALLSMVRRLIGDNARPVRATLFDKNPDANWALAFHQDLTIAVRERIDLPGWERWSVKAGVPHVQPPAQILEGMLAARVHLDDCTAENGALRVIPGSHRFGILSDEAADRLREEVAEVTCPVPAGGMMFMRPLLLHASSLAVTPFHRRVIHIEYAANDLPGGLSWYG